VIDRAIIDCLLKLKSIDQDKNELIQWQSTRIRTNQRFWDKISIELKLFRKKNLKKSINQFFLFNDFELLESSFFFSTFGTNEKSYFKSKLIRILLKQNHLAILVDLLIILMKKKFYLRIFIVYNPKQILNGNDCW